MTEQDIDFNASIKTSKNLQCATKRARLLQRMHHVLASPLPSIPSSALSPHETKQPPTKNMGEDIVHAGPSASPLP